MNLSITEPYQPWRRTKFYSQLMLSASSEALTDPVIVSKFSIWQTVCTNRVLQCLGHRQMNLKAK